MGDREQWRARYRRGDASTTSEPTRTLRQYAEELPAGRALDVATGAARDALFLAGRGYEVDALDISRVALTLARDRAEEQGVSVNWIQADIATFPLPEAAYDVITVSRFDARECLDALQRALVSGGVLVYNGFLEGDDREPPANYRFAPGELRDACSALEILHYEEGDGRVQLVARRPVE